MTNGSAPLYALVWTIRPDSPSRSGKIAAPLPTTPTQCSLRQGTVITLVQFAINDKRYIYGELIGLLDEFFGAV